MTENLSALLATELERLEATISAADAPDEVILDMSTTTSLMCSLMASIVQPESGTTGPMIVAHADISPGGRIADARVEALDGDETITRHVEPGTALHRALAVWFRDVWDSWDEVPEDTPGEVLGVAVSDLRSGDEVVRLGLTVASVEDGGQNSSGDPVLVVTFEEVVGTEVWPASRMLTIIRADGHEVDSDG